MHETGFQIAFWLIFAVVIFGVVLTAIAALAHFAIFGAIAGLVAKRIGEAPSRRMSSAADSRCGHCRSQVAAGVAECPNCGAPMT